MTRHALNRRTFLKATAALPALTATSGFLSVSAGAADLGKVDLQLGWLASNGILGEVVAKRKGFFKEEGVEFSITPGGPNVDGVASVASGRSGVGSVSSSPSLMLARNAGVPVKAIAAGYQKHPFTYFSLKKNPIKTPQDMIGKTIATQPTAFILARALLAKNNIPEDKVNLINMGADMTPLMMGQAAAATGWQTNTDALKPLGNDRVDMMLWDTGIQLYANVYYSNDETISKHSDALAAFMRATARGWGYARTHQAEAVDLLVSEYPILNKASEMDAVPLVVGFSFGDTTKANGWGQMTAENWQAQVEIYAKLGQFKGDPPKISDVMTLDILKLSEKTRKEVG
jgi:NitT/TauT family transport system substrate-binding protein